MHPEGWNWIRFYSEEVNFLLSLFPMMEAHLQNRPQHRLHHPRIMFGSGISGRKSSNELYWSDIDENDGSVVVKDEAERDALEIRNSSSTKPPSLMSRLLRLNRRRNPAAVVLSSSNKYESGRNENGRRKKRGRTVRLCL